MPNRTFALRPLLSAPLLSVLLLSVLLPLDAEARTLLHCGKVVDVETLEVLEARTIVVDGTTIAAVEAGYVEATEGDEVVNLKSGTCTPGWMDMHTHLSQQLGPQSYVEPYTLEPADYAFRMVGYAETTLLAGFTTVRDVGDGMKLTASLRTAINSGLVDGPRIFTAGKALATTGGHADGTNSARDGLYEEPGPKDGVINGADEAREAVRYRYKEGADLIKLTATGGVLSVAASGDNPQFTEEEIRAIVETANDYGFHVAAHAHGAEGLKRAVRAGVTTIEHGTYLDAEAIELMQQHGTYLVPTLVAAEWVMNMAKVEGFFPPVVAEKAARIGPLAQDMFRRAYEAGVKIAFGTDSCVSPHGDNAREFALMHEGGMPVLETIRAATLIPAQLLEIDDRLGTLEAGKTADIVAVPGDPRDGLEVMMAPSFVMKDGKIYKRP